MILAKAVDLTRWWWISATAAACAGMGSGGVPLAASPASTCAASSVLGRVGDAHFRETVAQSVAREAESAGGLALIAVGLTQGSADDFILPLIERSAGGQHGCGTS